MKHTNKFLLTFLCILILSTTPTTQQLLEGLIKLLQEGEKQMFMEPPDRNYMNREYDFIIVGAGTAGCVLANRLTENPKWNVLLIEAGNRENYLMDLPILANYLQFTGSNWKYKTQPTGKSCLAMKNGQCNFPRGKVIGGSSVLNYMIFTRGNRKDYDNWAANGNTGWSFEEVLPYFKKVENFQVPEYMNDTKHHSVGGHVTVSSVPYRTKLADAIVQSSLESGLSYVDYNGASDIGVSYLQASMKNGTRHSASRAYLHPIRFRKNLHVTKTSMVSKILIDPATKRAYGIEMIKGRQTMRIMAKREVILSAGAINSPVLLMQSGIGPRKNLEGVKIPVIKDLKVGYNLQDHVAHGGLTFIIDKPYTLTTTRMLETNFLTNFFNFHQGPLTIPGGCEALSFYDTERPGDPNGYPDMELLFQAGAITSDPLLRNNFGITDELYDAVYRPIEGKEAFMILPMLMRPKSKGRIMLKSSDYRVKPYIFPNYFAYQEDMDIMVRGVRLAIDLMNQPSLKKLGARLHSIPVPPCAKYGFNTDPYWACVTRYFSFTIYHQSGTCKMGPATDRSAVVDPRLRVHGIRGLRVIDASIMPDIPVGHTNGPTYMIAEKGADMIKEDWGYLTTTSATVNSRIG